MGNTQMLGWQIVNRRVRLEDAHFVHWDGDDLKFGGVSAAPVFAAVMEAALHDLGVPPDAP